MCQKDVFRNLHGLCVTCDGKGGWSGDLLIADCEDLHNPASLRYPRQTVQAPEEENGEYFWSMSGELVHKSPSRSASSKVVHPRRNNLPIPMKHIDVVRHTRTIIDNCSERTLNDNWNDEREVLLSKDSIGPSRFQILRMKLPTGYTWMNNPPAKVQALHDLIRSGHDNGPDSERNKNKRRRQPGAKKKPDCKKLVEKE